jgi:hypothetical protein
MQQAMELHVRMNFPLYIQRMKRWSKTILLGVFLYPVPLVAQYNDIVLLVTVNDPAGEPLQYPMIKLVDQNNPTGDAYHLLGDGKGLIEQRLTAVPGQPRVYEIEVIAEDHLSESLRLDATGMDLTSRESGIWTFEIAIRMREGAADPDGTLGATRCWYVYKTNEFKCEGRLKKAITIKRSNDPDLVARLAMITEEDAKTGVMVYGYLRDHYSDVGIADGEIHIIRPDMPDEVTTIRTNEFGFYAFTLGYDRIVHLRYAARGMVAKTVILDLMGIPEVDREGGYGTNIDVRLFEPIPGEDLSFLEKPMGRARYVAEEGRLDWDHSVSTPIIQQLDEILRRNRKR